MHAQRLVPSAIKIARQSRYIKYARHTVRNGGGYQLMEMMITMLVITIISTALLGLMASMFQLNTSSHNQVLSNMIIQEVIDNARNMSWDVLKDDTIFPKSTWIPLVVNQTTSNSGAPTSFARPLMLDMYNKTYSSEGSGKLFNGTARQKLEDLGDNQLRLTVEVSYPASNSGQSKTVSAATIISEFGLHNN